MTLPQYDPLRAQIYASMKERDTDELVEIWRAHNQMEWTDEAFEVVVDLLRERHALPGEDQAETAAVKTNPVVEPGPVPTPGALPRVPARTPSIDLLDAAARLVALLLIPLILVEAIGFFAALGGVSLTGWQPVFNRLAEVLAALLLGAFCYAALRGLAAILSRLS